MEARLAAERDDLREIGRRYDAAIDSMEEERAWLRSRIEYLEEMLERRNRFESGMPEKPRDEREKLDPMPMRLRKHIEKWASPHLKRQAYSTAYRRRISGESWEAITNDVISSEEDDSAA